MSDIRTAQSNGMTLAYETFGDPDDVPILLVMGLGAQMLAWHDEFCAMLAERGHYVIRFDNRDMGLSTHLDDAGAGQPVAAFLSRKATYLLSDMAADAAGLIGALELGSVHVVGVSMGGCISQELTLARPELIRSLTSMSSSTASRWVGRPRFEVAARMLSKKRATNREQAIEMSLATWRRIGSPGYPLDVDRIRRLAGEAYDRCYDPKGSSRQFAAVLATPDRTPRLPGITVPALVMHGEADPLINMSGGAATAAAIPDSRFVTFPGMGHDLPEPLWPRFVDEITAVVARGEQHR